MIGPYRSEHQEQVAVMEWAALLAKLTHPELQLLHAIPNGGKRHVGVARKLKAEGAKAGVPDLHLPVSKGKYVSLYVEMKKVDLKPKRNGKGGVSVEQAWWIKELRKYQNKVVVCYGADEAIEAISNYLHGSIK